MQAGEPMMAEAGPSRWIVDRFEGEVAVVEVDGERFVRLPRWLLPDGTRADDVVEASRRVGDDGAVTWEVRIDRQATAAAEDDAERLVDELRKKDPGGDVVL